MNIIKYLVYLLIVFSIVKYYQKSMIDNNLILSIAIIIVIGFMITDSFFQPKIQEGFGSVGNSGICNTNSDCKSGLVCSQQIGGPNYLCVSPNASSKGVRK